MKLHSLQDIAKMDEMVSGLQEEWLQIQRIKTAPPLNYSDSSPMQAQEEEEAYDLNEWLVSIRGDGPAPGLFDDIPDPDWSML